MAQLSHNLLTGATALLASAALVACGSGNTEQTANVQSQGASTLTKTATPSSSAAPSSSTTSSADDSTEKMNDASAVPPGRPQDAEPNQTAGDYDLKVKDVRTGHHDGFDRVVIELTGQATPGWHAEYQNPPVQQGSGKPLPFQGNSALNVFVKGVPMPTDGQDSLTIGKVADGAGNIKSVDYRGTYEANAQFVIGVDHESKFNVTLVQNPTRVVIDVQG